MKATETRQQQRRNIRFGILNCAFAEVGKTPADPNAVLSLFVRRLGASNVLVGFPSTLRYGSWFLPQILAATRIQHRTRRGSVYVSAELLRVSATP